MLIAWILDICVGQRLQFSANVYGSRPRKPLKIASRTSLLNLFGLAMLVSFRRWKGKQRDVIEFYLLTVYGTVFETATRIN